MLRTLAVSNYRSLRNFIAPLGELTLITGPDGSGSQALRLGFRGDDFSYARVTFIAALKENIACLSIELDKQLSETQILGQGKLDVPSWHWLNR